MKEIPMPSNTDIITTNIRELFLDATNSTHNSEKTSSALQTRWIPFFSIFVFSVFGTVWCGGLPSAGASSAGAAAPSSAADVTARINENRKGH